MHQKTERKLSVRRYVEQERIPPVHPSYYTEGCQAVDRRAFLSARCERTPLPAHAFAACGQCLHGGRFFHGVGEKRFPFALPVCACPAKNNPNALDKPV